jgi:large subunit ribosomal protein L21
MFAVIRTGGKQYTVAKDDMLSVERLAGDVGAKLTLGEVLMLGGDKPKSGSPLVAGASVTAEIVEQGRGEKVVAFKKKRRKNTHRKRGHRQPFTLLKITAIHAHAKHEKHEKEEAHGA